MLLRKTFEKQMGCALFCVWFLHSCKTICHKFYVKIITPIPNELCEFKWLTPLNNLLIKKIASFYDQHRRYKLATIKTRFDITCNTLYLFQAKDTCSCRVNCHIKNDILLRYRNKIQLDEIEWRSFKKLTENCVKFSKFCLLLSVIGQVPEDRNLK